MVLVIHLVLWFSPPEPGHLLERVLGISPGGREEKDAESVRKRSGTVAESMGSFGTEMAQELS